MKTCAVNELFDVRYGNGLELAYLHQSSVGYNFVARGKKNNGVVAVVEKVIGEQPFPAGSITVAVSGSVMESFLQVKPFYTSYHVMVLNPLPGVEMSDAVKLFYCLCLRHNKFRYSYGRQANETLKSLQIPCLEDVPNFVKFFSLERFKKNLVQSVDLSTLAEKADNTGIFTDLVPLSELFVVENGIAASNLFRSAQKRNDNWIPFIRPSYRQSTSVDAYVNKFLVPQEKVFPKGTLYVSTNGQGSHTYSYVSVSEFVPNSDVSVLIPKRLMTLREKLFYAMCITRNRYKFSYGRKPKGEKLEAILLPRRIFLQYNEVDMLNFLENLS
jgi:hypothetical protein